jgi:DNA-binding transcriptional LysR family regulator
MLDRLTLDQLRVLIAVAETGSFSAAARQLGRVQSAVSQAVATLEDILGTALFDRYGKTPKLNEAGRVILADARRLVQGAETLRARAESIGTDVEPELTIAVDAMFPNSILMASLKALSETFGCLPVTVFTEGLGTPEQRLRDGVVRLAIYCLLSTGANDLEAEYLTAIRVARGRTLAIGARQARAAGPARPDRPHPTQSFQQRRHHQRPHLAVCRPWYSPGIPLGWLRLVQHARSHGRGPHRGGPSQAPHLDRDRRVRFPDPRGPRARPRAGPGRTLAARRPAPAAEDHQGSVKYGLRHQLNLAKTVYLVSCVGMKRCPFLKCLRAGQGLEWRPRQDSNLRPTA